MQSLECTKLPSCTRWREAFVIDDFSVLAGDLDCMALILCSHRFAVALTSAYYVRLRV